jgi:MoaA/NifB/PqqE/SkfB family radical SAM enzyme
LLNWLLVETLAFFKPDIPWSWPPYLEIEPTTHCNLRCGLCPITSGLDRLIRHMDFGIFNKLIDEIGEYALIIFLGLEEMFLNLHIYEIISYTKQKGISLMSSTRDHLFV